MEKKNIAQLLFLLLPLGCLFYLLCHQMTNNEASGAVQEEAVGNPSDMEITLEVSLSDALKSFAGTHATDSIFKSALNSAEKNQGKTQGDFMDHFAEAFKSNGHPLSSLFSDSELNKQINSSTSDEKVIKILKKEVKSTTDQTINILRSRLKKLGISKPEIRSTEVEGQILIKLLGIKSPERIRKMLISPGNLEFWETYKLSEIITNVEAVNTMARGLESTPELVKMDSLFKILSIDFDKNSNSYYSSEIGRAETKDTAVISSYFKLAKEEKLIPADLHPAWCPNRNSDGQKSFSLIALRSTGKTGKAAMSGNLTQEAKAEFYEEEKESAITINMTPQAAKDWQALTGRSINNTIGIVLDGLVYCYPRVNCEISCGRCQIVGEFTFKEANDLANLLNTGPLPVSVKIIEEKVTDSAKK